jgi:hypothetical protein
MKKWLAFVVVGLVAGTLAWPKSSAVVRAAQGNPLVQIVPPGQKQVGNPGEKGATYYGLEAQTTRLTTRFRDGHVAVTERGLIGEVTTTLRDDGNEARTAEIESESTADTICSTSNRGGAPFRRSAIPPLKPTLDWARVRRPRQRQHRQSGLGRRDDATKGPRAATSRVTSSRSKRSGPTAWSRG